MILYLALIKMAKCEICNKKANGVCELCETPFCKNHGDVSRNLCKDCIEFSKEEKTGVEQEDFEGDEGSFD